MGHGIDMICRGINICGVVSGDRVSKIREIMDGLVEVGEVIRVGKVRWVL